MRCNPAWRTRHVSFLSQHGAFAVGRTPGAPQTHQRARLSQQTDAIRKAAFLEDPVKKKRRLDLIAEKLVQKAMAGDNWCIGQIGDRLDGKPKERQEHEGVVDHAIRIVWAGMPAFPAAPSAPQIDGAAAPALPSPQPDEQQLQPVVVDQKDSDG